jgi:uncharacterized LabA/DUF88 family protein
MGNRGRRNFVFIDGQNLYLSAKRAFGLRYPDFDIPALGRHLSDRVGGSDAVTVRFYIGMPIARFSPMWTRFWTNKLNAAREAGVDVTTRELRYLTETDPHAPGGVRVLSAREKGIDLRIALDVMAAARSPDCKNILIVSRDQDFREVIGDIKTMCAFTRKEIGLWSAFPVVDDAPALNRGVDGTREIRISRSDYDRNRDPADYRQSPAHDPEAAEPDPA